MKLLTVLMMTGCPSEFGKHGRVANAVHQDTLELVRKYCSPAELKKFCGGNKKNSQECRDECGE
ncbi:hypothetical protein [Stigmatella hybrida]|uniref:hypothetical protein n=1 Tax=Stigmatella hybrida TaxID=394097 RepID=UPI001CDAB17A|nr:hypothetical protein [Stigmatella hybrida]